MELTQEHFDKSVKLLATQQSVDDLTVRVDTIERNQNIHTKALDRLLKDMETRDQERIIGAERFKRLEDWAKKVSEKIGIQIEF